jgi:hypothetical protein
VPVFRSTESATITNAGSFSYNKENMSFTLQLYVCFCSMAEWTQNFWNNQARGLRRWWHIIYMTEIFYSILRNITHYLQGASW